MKRIGGLVAALIVSSLLMAGAANGDVLRTRDRDRLQDGSCTAAIQLKTQDQTQDRLKDGSCTAAIQLKTQDRDRLMDGSCLASLRTRDRDRLKDGSCLGGAAKTRLRDRVRANA